MLFAYRSHSTCITEWLPTRHRCLECLNAMLAMEEDYSNNTAPLSQQPMPLQTTAQHDRNNAVTDVRAAPVLTPSRKYQPNRNNVVFGSNVVIGDHVVIGDNVIAVRPEVDRNNGLERQLNRKRRTHLTAVCLVLACILSVPLLVSSLPSLTVRSGLIPFELDHFRDFVRDIQAGAAFKFDVLRPMAIR